MIEGGCVQYTSLFVLQYCHVTYQKHCSDIRKKLLGVHVYLLMQCEQAWRNMGAVSPPPTFLPRNEKYNRELFASRKNRKISWLTVQL